MVASKFFSSPTAVGSASAWAFPDALSGGSHIGRKGGPIVLVPTSGALPSSVQSYFGSIGPKVSSAYLYGGTSAVGDDVRGEIGSALAAGTGTNAVASRRWSGDLLVLIVAAAFGLMQVVGAALRRLRQLHS
jgi:hypothetical protein